MQQKEIEPLGHPWRRYFARAFDLYLYRLLLDIVQHLLLHWNPPQNLLIVVAKAYLTIGLMLILEPILLHLWGTTPGKWILGLSIQTVEGNHLSLKQGFARIWTIFCYGLGYGLPFYDLYRMWQCRKECEQRSLSWEKNSNQTLRNTAIWRGITYVAVYGLLFIATLAVLYQAAFFPAHRGELTYKQLADNFNCYFRYNGFDELCLQEDGSWKYQNEINTNEANDIGIFPFDSTPRPKYYFFEQDGKLSGVSLILDLDVPAEEAPPLIFDYAELKYAAIVSFVFAQPGTSLWAPFQIKEVADIKSEFQPYAFTFNGMYITNEIIYQGLEEVPFRGASILETQRDEDCQLYMAFHIRKA